MALTALPILISTDPISPPTPEEASEAFARIQPELASVGPRDFVRITTDVSKAVAIGIGAVPRIMQHRAAIVSELPAFPIAMVDKLQDYAFGAFYAHAVAGPAPVDPRLASLLAEAAELRGRMLVTAETMVVFGMLDAARVAEIKAGSGHIDTAEDLVALSAMFKEHWSSLQGKQPLTAADISRASKLGSEIMLVVGPKTVAAKVGDAAAVTVDADRRARAFSLFVNTYEACRRAIAYLRWNEGDADTIAPSLFALSRRRPAPAQDDTEPTEAPATPDAPTA